MKIVKQVWFWFFILISVGISQEGEIIPISGKIGSEIDAEENMFYGIFPEINGFESAQFYDLGNNKYIARIVFVEFTHRRLTRKAYSLREFVTLQNYVNSQPQITNEDRQKLGLNLAYLKTDEVLKSIPENQFIIIQHRDNKRVKGSLRSYDGEKIEIQTPVSILSIPIWELESISYRPAILEHSTWKLAVFFASAIAGLALSEIWNIQKSPRAEKVWYHRFWGLTLGFLAGGEVYDSINILTSPKQKFNLSPSEREKLKKK